MRKLLGGGILAWLMVMAPFGVMAQATPFDEATQAVVVAVAQRVGSTLAPGITDGDTVARPYIVEGPEAPAPEMEDPVLEPEGELVDLPPLNLTDLVEYSSQGVTFLAPADWIVETDVWEDSPFMIEVPGTDLFISLEADAGLEFPSWLGVALFRSQTDLLMTELGDDAEIVESTTIYTEQNLPFAKLAFTGVDNGEEIGGTLFVTAPNEDAYILIGGGPRAHWAYAAPGIDLIAQSITFDEELISVILVEDEPLLFADEDEIIEVVVPVGWYVMGTGEPRFPVIVAEPEARYVAAVGNEEVFGGDFDVSILELIPEEGELDPELYDELFDAILDLVASSGSPIDVDEELSTFVERDGGLTVRLVGDAELEDGLTMPVIFYIDLRSRGDVGVVAVFGDIESAFAVEEMIQEMLESVTGL